MLPGHHYETRRLPQPAPTKPGWYYGLLGGPNTKMSPCYVVETPEGGLMVVGRFRNFTINQFEWFGPVPTCIEGREP